MKQVRRSTTAPMPRCAAAAAGLMLLCGRTCPAAAEVEEVEQAAGGWFLRAARLQS